MGLIGDIAEGIGNVLGSEAARPVLIEVGRQIYAHNNPPETRSLPPVAYPLPPPQLVQGPMPQPAPGGFVDVFQEYIGMPSGSAVGNIIDYFQGQTPPGGGSQVANGLMPHAQHPPLFRARQGTAVGQRVIPVMNPQTGKTHFFGDLGTPLLFSRDFAAHKRVNRLARKAGRGRTRSRKRR